MGFFERALSWAEGGATTSVVPSETRNTNLINLADQGDLAEWFGAETSSGNRIGAKNALQVTTALACVRAISEGLSQVPLALMRRRADGGSDVAIDHPLYSTIDRQPNDWQTWFEFVETLTAHAALTGNGFAFKAMTTRRTLSELIPIPPGNCSVIQNKDLSITYQVNDSHGHVGNFTQDDVFHLRGPSWDGINGWDIARLARNAIGLAAATEESQAKVHANGGRVAGILSSAQGIAPDVMKRIREAWTQQYAGSKNSGKTVILDNGMTYTAMAQSHVEMQTLEARKLQIEEVCRAFMVYPQVIGHADKASTYASAEQFFLAHVRNTLQPWARRWEQKLKSALLTASPADKGVYFRFDLDELQRGDSTARANFYAKAIAAGWMTRNEARGSENMNPLDGLDEPLIPLNMVGGDGADAEDAADTATDGDTGKEPKK